MAAKKFPIVKYWLAWNEPNSPVFLRPQYVPKRVRVKGKLTTQWVMQSAVFGLSYAKQAQYLRQTWNIVRANPRIGMLIWFIFQDDTNIKLGWQSGLLTYTGVKKPSYEVFKTLPG